MTFRIEFFEPKYQAGLVSMIERIQVNEFHLPIDESQRKELESIPDTFRKENGNYWVALFNEKVIGSIAVLDIGNNAFELRDVFLDKEYRGPITDFAKKLLNTVIDWSNQHQVTTIYLGTTLFFERAHKFYEKNGFIEIPKSALPPYCKPMECDKKFYKLDLEIAHLEKKHDHK